MDTMFFTKAMLRNYLIILFPALFPANSFSQDASLVKNNAVVSYINANPPYKITNVIVDKSHVTIQGTIAAGTGNVYLCELQMFDETKLGAGSFASITPINASKANFQIQLDRIGNRNNKQYDRLYSRWIITSKTGNNYRAQSYAHYADDIAGAAVRYLPEEKPSGKKGLEGFFQESFEPDLADLNIKNVTVNITLPQVISLEPTQYSYQFNGVTYYMNPKTIALYDREFKLCSDQNVFVSAVILIQQNSPQNIKSVLVHPDANAGIQSMANITSQQGFSYYAALIGFLAERYNKPDKQYGRIQNWIVHNEVDNGVHWANAGNVKMEYYTELYDRVMRTTYYTVRQYNPAAKVFISLTHGWAVAARPTFYAPKYMLALLNDLSKKQGDYEWGVAFHPYSEDITNPMPWVDKDAKMDLNSTHIITSKNIELIDTWMRMPAHLYKGQKVRTLLFSEQGANTKSDSQQDMLMQAAVIAYMWKKCTRLPSVESFDYHAQCDNRNESGLRFGLWIPKPGTIATPGQKKTSWYVYQKAETSSEDSAFAFALKIIGINSWSQAFNKLSTESLPRTITFSVTKNNKPVNDALVYFNGEMHKTLSGKAVFYNVAAMQKNRIVTIVYSQQTVFSKQDIKVNTDQTFEVVLK